MSTARIGRHVAYNVMGVVLPTAITIFTTPLYLRRIGQERFGVLALLWIVVGYFGLLDLGLSRASANRLAVVQDREKAVEIFWAAVWTSFAIGVAGSIALYLGGRVWLSRTTSTAFTLEMAQALPFLALFVPLSTCGGVKTGALESRQRFLTVNAVAIAGTLLFALLPLAVAEFFTTSLGWLVPAALLSRSISFLWLSLAVTRVLGVRRIVSPARHHVRDLLSFGGWAAVSSFIGTIMNSVDKIIIGAALGAAAVSHYVVPYNALSRMSIVPNALLRALFPRMSQADAQSAKTMEVNALALLTVVMTGLCCALILNLRALLMLWLGSQLVPITIPIAIVLSAGIWCNSLATVPYLSLQARQKPQVPARIHLLQVLPYIAALLLALRFFGLMGAAVAWSARMLTDGILLARVSKYSARAWRPVYLGGALIAVATAIALTVANWRALICVTAMVAPLFVIWARRASPQLRQKTNDIWRTVLRRGRSS